MKHILILFLFIILACKPTKQEVAYEYLSEKGTKHFFNWDDKKKPLLVIIPALHNSELTLPSINYLTKKYRVAYLPYLSSENVLRQNQLDNINLREQLYSDLLTDLTYNSSDSVFSLLAEGLNANVASHIAGSYKPRKLILLNAWYPTINQAILNQCYMNDAAGCDSLAAYLSLADKTSLTSLMDALNVGETDNIYGRHNLLFWKQAKEYDALPKKHNYTATVKYIFTQNSGLMRTAEKQNTVVTTNKELHAVLLDAMRN